MRRRLRPWTLLLALLAGLAASSAQASPSLEELDAKGKRALSDAARAYFDPTLESLYTPRRNFLAALDKLRADRGWKPLSDLGLMRQIVYEGRSFLPRFSDQKWRQQNEITDFKTTGRVYNHLKAEQYRFTYCEPEGYPKESDLDKKILRHAPYPLLLVLHEEADLVDGKGAFLDYPGEAILGSRYAKDAFAPLYKDWFLLAPIAPRAQFLKDGRIQYRFSTDILSQFWKRYHVDFDRIVLDGAADALAIASVLPHVFAGLVVRGGTVDPALVPNFAAVPVYVVGKPELKKALDEAGHPDVTVGDEKGLMAWLAARRRTPVKSFHWTVQSPEHVYANWLTIPTAVFAESPAPTVDVEVVDTEQDPNTIRITARGVETITVFLSDELVDLERDVRLVLNGEERNLGKLARDFGQLFEKGWETRKNMYFGWLYTVWLGEIPLPPPAAPEAAAPTEPPPSEPVVGDPADEKKASVYWRKAEEAEQERRFGDAIELYQLIVKLPTNSLSGKAQKRIAELEAASTTSNEPQPQ